MVERICDAFGSDSDDTVRSRGTLPVELGAKQQRNGSVPYLGRESAFTFEPVIDAMFDPTPFDHAERSDTAVDCPL